MPDQYITLIKRVSIPQWRIARGSRLSRLCVLKSSRFQMEIPLKACHMISKITVFLLVVTTALLGGCATSYEVHEGKTVLLRSEGVRQRSFNATSVVYAFSPAPSVSQSRFKSDVEINVRGEVKSFRFTNHIGKGEKARKNVVMVALSGREGGFGIYDESGAILAEYPKGKVMGNAAMFEMKTDKGKLVARWLFAENTIASVIESYGSDGALLYSEITIYRPR